MERGRPPGSASRPASSLEGQRGATRVMQRWDNASPLINETQPTRRYHSVCEPYTRTGWTAVDAERPIALEACFTRLQLIKKRERIEVAPGKNMQEHACQFDYMAIDYSSQPSFETDDNWDIALE